MTCLQPKQSMNSLLGVKIAQNPYFWFGYNSSKWRKITHSTCFSTNPKKSPWEFLYPVKKWSPKNSFSKRKNLRESIESNFYKLVNLIAKDLPVCTIFQKTQPVKKLLSMLSQVFSLRKWVFLAIIFWLDREILMDFFWVVKMSLHGLSDKICIIKAQSSIYLQ